MEVLFICKWVDLTTEIKVIKVDSLWESQLANDLKFEMFRDLSAYLQMELLVGIS